MPAGEFLKVLGREPSLNSLTQASTEFLVSLHAAAIRCEELAHCVAARVGKVGTIEWQTKHIQPSLPEMKALVAEMLAGRYEAGPIYMNSEHHSGYWSVEFILDEEGCTLFMRPVLHPEPTWRKRIKSPPD